MSWRAGGCHCGVVRFEAQVPVRVEVQSCNCSICAMTGYMHIIVPQSRFRICSGEDLLTTYRFNTGVAEHLFCPRCGIKCFYRPRSNPDGWSVNARCLDSADDLEMDLSQFDGRNWEKGAAALAHLSQEPA